MEDAYLPLFSLFSQPLLEVLSAAYVSSRLTQCQYLSGRSNAGDGIGEAESIRVGAQPGSDKAEVGHQHLFHLLHNLLTFGIDMRKTLLDCAMRLRPEEVHPHMLV